MSITRRTHDDVLFAALTATLLLGGCGAEAPSAPVEGGPPRPPAVVHVDPTSSTLQTGADQQFTGIGLSSGGDTMDVALAWSATGGSIAPDGLYTAGDDAGTFHVVVEHASGLADSARVTIEAPAEDTGTEPEPAPRDTLVAIEVRPDSVTLAPGAQRQFTAIGLTEESDTTNVEVTWTASGGAVSADGLYTAGDADGAFHAVAEHVSGLADSGAVVIRTPLPDDTASGEEPEPVASVTVSPNSVELQVDDTATLEATVENADGDPLERTVAWSSSDDSVASVDEHGTVRARSAGEAAITAASGGESDTATVTVTAPEEPSAPEDSLVAVRVEPDTATLETGVERQFSAAGITSGGDTTGVEVAWSATGGTITADGLYTAGETEGAFRVVAAHDSGLADTADVTVEAPPPESAAECDDPDEAWIWCDDFEADRLSSYFEYASGGGAFTREAGVGRGGSTGMRTRFEAGDVSAGALHLAFGRTPDPYFDPVDAGTSDYREIYWRIYVRNEPGWIGGGGDKLSRATVFATSGWAQAMIAHVWSGGSDPDWNYLVIDPASGTDEEGVLQTTKYNDFGNLRWLGLDRGDVPLFDGSHVGAWYCVEAHVRLNDPGSANGVFELWIDGKKDAERTGLNWVGSYDEYGVNAVFVENYWNDGSPQTQERYFDDFVVSTERIGC